MITMQDVRRFCQRRLTDLVLSRPPESYVLALHGQLDDYGDFFTILTTDVEYVEIAGSMAVGDLVLAQANDLGRFSPTWSRLALDYSGPALVILGAVPDAAGRADGPWVVIANTLEVKAGKDWAHPPVE